MTALALRSLLVARRKSGIILDAAGARCYWRRHAASRRSASRSRPRRMTGQHHARVLPPRFLLHSRVAYRAGQRTTTTISFSIDFQKT